MKFSTFLTIALSFALGLAFTLDTAAAPVQALELGQLQQRHEHRSTAETDVNAVAAAEAATAKDDTPPTKTFSLIPCPTNWTPLMGHGPVCSKAAGTPREAEKANKHLPLDYGLGP